ncbi:MAG: DUF535 family protein [Acidaminococcaceae bacterium]
MSLNWPLLKSLGQQVYKLEDYKDYKRYYVFLARCYLNQAAMAEHLAFFEQTPLRRQLLQGTPFFVDQATRCIFYKNSTCAERIAAIQEHLCILEELFTTELLTKLYVDGHRVPLLLTEFEGEPLMLCLVFRDGQQKEGCLALELIWGTNEVTATGWDSGTHVYQIMFNFARDPYDQKLILFVGALQGLNGGADLIKRLTKTYHGYRTKNYIFWGLRSLAQALEVKYIRAVTNKGYYAMNHYRYDRKLKVDLDAFWAECEGTPDSDYRFYTIPIDEHRKTMSELKPSKRATYRRRFEFLDQLRTTLQAGLKPYLK